MNENNLAYKKYTYNTISWIGPECDDVNNNITIKNISDKKLKSHCPYNSLLFLNKHNQDMYVIYSTFLILEGDETVFGPPRTYQECFQDIMNFVSDEIIVNERRKFSTDGSIKACLECHKIISYENKTLYFA